MIWTFYSYKGGVGRSMALANIGQWAFNEGLKVIIVDWDLEAPNIENFFCPTNRQEEIRSQLGLMDILVSYKNQFSQFPFAFIEVITRELEKNNYSIPWGKLRNKYPSFQNYIGSVEKKITFLKGEGVKIEEVKKIIDSELSKAIIKEQFPSLSNFLIPIHKSNSSNRSPAQGLFLLSAGWRAGAQFNKYVDQVQNFDWGDFYENYRGECFWNWMQDELSEAGDLTLIDSRTGVSEMGGVCTRQLADIVVCLCAPNFQNLEGVLKMAESFKRPEVLAARGSKKIEVVLVPSRVDSSELKTRNNFLAKFAAQTKKFTPGIFERKGIKFEDFVIPYIPKFAFFETLTLRDGGPSASLENWSSELEKVYIQLAKSLALLAPAGNKVRQVLAAEYDRELREKSPRTKSLGGRVFISYSMSDGESFARDLRQKLIECGFSLWDEKSESSHKSIWTDRSNLIAGKGWWDQILEAFKEVEYMVLVMTQASLDSPIVRKEWRQARQEGVGVIPVFGQPHLDLSQLPRWMRDVHWVNTDVPEQWARFIRTLESPYQATRVPFMADDLPAGYVLRTIKLEELVTSLLDSDQENSVAITVALKGPGGCGKTILARALCHDERIQDAFHDGILWVTLGENPNIMAGLKKLYTALTGERPNFVDVEDVANKLAEIIAEKDCLMVVDDVWNAAHAIPFLRGGKRCARVITTRDSATIPANTGLLVDVDTMGQNEALALLAFDLPEGETVTLRALAAKLGEWPFLLKLVNGTLRDRVNVMGQPLPDALAYVQKALDKRGLTAFDARDPVERHQAVAITLGASFEHLKDNELARYQELAIFPEDVEVPLLTISKLWGATGGLDEFETEELCTRLNQLSLIWRYDFITNTIKLHDVLRTYLEEQVASQLPTLHGKFLDAYNLKYEPKIASRDPYLSRYLAYHLARAGRGDEPI